jgi:hypothetical protein
MYRLCGYRYAICKFFTPTINTRTRKRYMVTQQNTATDTSSLSSRLGHLGLYLGGTGTVTHPGDISNNVMSYGGMSSNRRSNSPFAQYAR